MVPEDEPRLRRQPADYVRLRGDLSTVRQFHLTALERATVAKALMARITWLQRHAADREDGDLYRAIQMLERFSEQ